jgi:endonuclease III
MKNGTLYAKKLKQALSRIRGSAPQTPLEYADAIEQLIVAVLSQEAGLSSAHRAMRQLREDMVDYNELRVSTPAEVVASIDKHISDAEKPAEALIRVLNAIYRNEFAVTLDRLAGKGVRETKAYLDELDGMTPYVSASVLLWSLGGHAIPVNDRALDQLRREELVDPAADTAEVQAFSGAAYQRCRRQGLRPRSGGLCRVQESLHRRQPRGPRESGQSRPEDQPKEKSNHRQVQAQNQNDAQGHRRGQDVPKDRIQDEENSARLTPPAREC